MTEKQSAANTSESETHFSEVSSFSDVKSFQYHVSNYLKSLSF